MSVVGREVEPRSGRGNRLASAGRVVTRPAGAVGLSSCSSIHHPWKHASLTQQRHTPGGPGTVDRRTITAVRCAVHGAWTWRAGGRSQERRGSEFPQEAAGSRSHRPSVYDGVVSHPPSAALLPVTLTTTHRPDPIRAVYRFPCVQCQYANLMMDVDARYAC